MNPQIGFRDEKGLTSGQFDPNEGLIYSKPFGLRYSTDGINWKTLAPPENSISIKRNSNAYIFCMYSVQYEPSNYDAISKTYTQIIPWRYIKDFSIGGETNEIEILIFLDSVAFRNILCEAADKAGFSYSSGLISYDLEKKQTDFNYVHDVMNDTAYSAKSAHPFQRNGAPFRLKLSKAQLGQQVTCFLYAYPCQEIPAGRLSKLFG